MLSLVWAGLGLCMAATLYEPAFAIVARANDDPSVRLRALGIVTLLGGLASTVFLPLTDALVRAGGWRVGVMVLALLLVLSTWLTHRFASEQTQAVMPGMPIARREVAPARSLRSGTKLPFLLVAFSFASLSSTAVIANLVPALAERAVTPTTAAAVGGMFGLMQLPGRALMMRGRIPGSPYLLLAISLGLQALGLTAWALVPLPVAAFAGISVFAVGSGLSTLVRPHLVHTTFARDEAGYVNGRLAQAQQLARAAGPVLAAWAVSAVSYGVVLAALGGAFGALALWSLMQAASRPAATPGIEALSAPDVTTFEGSR